MKAAQAAPQKNQNEYSQYSNEELRNILINTKEDIVKINDESKALSDKRKELESELHSMTEKSTKLDGQIRDLRLRIPTQWAQALEASEILEQWEKYQDEYNNQYEELNSNQDAQMLANSQWIEYYDQMLGQSIPGDKFAQHKSNMGEIHKKTVANYKITKTPNGKLQVQLNACINALIDMGYNLEGCKGSPSDYEECLRSQLHGRHDSNQLICQQYVALQSCIGECATYYDCTLKQLSENETLATSLEELNVKLKNLESEKLQLESEISSQLQENEQKKVELQRKTAPANDSANEIMSIYEKIQNCVSKAKSNGAQLSTDLGEAFETLIYGKAYKHITDGPSNITGEIETCLKVHCKVNHDKLSLSEIVERLQKRTDEFEVYLKKCNNEINEGKQALERTKFKLHSYENMLNAMNKQYERRRTFLTGFVTGHSEDQTESVNDEDQGYSKS